ncbi:MULTISPECIES: helix-turn-helix domain-containing protein [unclassified Halomonas]|uniref:helix-turn-helix domain-containing protein n=1 Tax=unclassified Halomonas TaxID=2609666 RepID=UPI0007F0BCCE|nr:MULTISPECIES: transcriptional regulator [unclassified Halomonas]SBR46138.1 HTH-type transcriptional regulator / antitoxin HigA [Halomonas sp. HL-93]SNY98603.1 HTH-type transcriptional regulator / antitoxin HigA [Halomonas sp. hl-4]
MNATPYLEEAKAVFHAVPFLSHIHSEAEYQEALTMVGELIDDVDNNIALIERLTDAIEEWENASKEFTEFNAGVQSQDAVDMLRSLMDQHGLGVADLPEIGSKSLVSRILNRKGRDLTRRHIEALAKRFGVSPALFFH